MLFKCLDGPVTQLFDRPVFVHQPFCFSTGSHQAVKTADAKMPKVHILDDVVHLFTRTVLFTGGCPTDLHFQALQVIQYLPAVKLGAIVRMVYAPFKIGWPPGFF